METDMIKDIKTLSKSCRFDDDLVITEKLDTFFFKVIVTATSTTLLNRKHRIINDSDLIVNSMWGEVDRFVAENIDPHKETIADRFGNVILGFFFLPVAKPHSISYDRLFSPDSISRFIISSVKSIGGRNEISTEEFCSLMTAEGVELKGAAGGPKIIYPIGTIDMLNSYIAGTVTRDELCEWFSVHLPTYSGNPFGDIEGLIFNERGRLCQFVVNGIQEETAADVRDFDLVTREFLVYFAGIDIESLRGMSYLDIVNTLFVGFIGECGSEFADVNPDNLLPPGNTYIGEPSYNMIGNSTVETICRLNGTYCNIYRILFKGLKKRREKTDYTTLDWEEIDSWNAMVKMVEKVMDRTK